MAHYKRCKNNAVWEVRAVDNNNNGLLIILIQPGNDGWESATKPVKLSQSGSETSFVVYN